MNNNREFARRLASDFGITQNLSDVIFTECNIREYHNGNRESLFGEKLSLIYTSNFTIYNVQFSLKVLAFTYVSCDLLLVIVDIN